MIDELKDDWRWQLAMLLRRISDAYAAAAVADCWHRRGRYASPYQRKDEEDDVELGKHDE